MLGSFNDICALDLVLLLFLIFEVCFLYMTDLGSKSGFIFWNKERFGILHHFRAFTRQTSGVFKAVAMARMGRLVVIVVMLLRMSVKMWSRLRFVLVRLAVALLMLLLL